MLIRPLHLHYNINHIETPFSFYGLIVTQNDAFVKVKKCYTFVEKGLHFLKFKQNLCKLGPKGVKSLIEKVRKSAKSERNYSLMGG